jgi:hypothetical protein
MADDAIKILQQAIEAAKREGYAEGFAAAMQLVREFSSSASAPEQGKSGPPKLLKVKPLKARYIPRIPGSIAVRFVETAYQSISPRAAGAAEIRRIVKTQNETDLPETTIRRSIDDLEARSKIRRIPGTKTWVYGDGEMGGGSIKSDEGSSSSVPRGPSNNNGAAPMRP